MITNFFLIKFILEHYKSMSNGKWTIGRFIKGYNLFKIREGRGSGYIDMIWNYLRKGVDISFMAWFVFNYRIPPTDLIKFAIGYVIVSYILGYFDHTRVNVMQNEAEISTMINPYYVRLEKKIDNISKDVEVLRKNGRLKLVGKTN